MSLFTLFRKMFSFTGLCGNFVGLLLGKYIFEQVCLNKLVQAAASKKNQINHLQNGRYIHFTRFSLAIQTLTTTVSYFYVLIFTFVIMAVNCCTIHHFSIMQQIIDKFLVKQKTLITALTKNHVEIFNFIPIHAFLRQSCLYAIK